MLTLTGVGNGEIDQIVPGSGGLTKNGPGTWTLTGVNTYTGTTTVNSGTLRIVNGGQVYGNLNGNLAGAITINSGAAVEFDNYAYGTCFGQLWDTSGNILVNGGTLRYVGSGNTSGDQSLTIGPNGAILDSATSGQLWTIASNDVHSLASNSGGLLTLTGVGNGQIDQIIPGSGGLTMQGSGAWTLTANNIYTGDTTVNGGTLNLAAFFGTLSGNLIVNNGGTVYAGTEDAIWNGTSNLKTLTINAGGLATLGSQACDLGPVVLSGGTLDGAGEPYWGSWWLNGAVTTTGSAVSTMSAIGMTLVQTQTFSVESGGTLNITGDFIPTPALNGGGIIKTGPGIMLLSGTNDYIGGTVVAGGMLVAANSQAIADDTNLSIGSELSKFSTVLSAHTDQASIAHAIAPVPEPGTLALLVAGASLLIHRSRRHFIGRRTTPCG
jgi:autotransporter-associated beta strand protein